MISSLTCSRFESPAPRRVASLTQVTVHRKEPAMRRLFVSSALMLLALTPAIAQSTEKPHTPTLGIGNPGVAAPHLTNVPDRVFVIRATLGGAAEIELARLAEQKTRNDAVRDFARHMIRDHSQADNALSRLARSEGIPLPEGPDAKQREIRDGLSRLSGPEAHGATDGIRHRIGRGC